MILIDYNHVMLRSILGFTDDLKNGSDVFNLARHVMLSTILQYKRKYGAQYGKIVICCDGRKYWRKDIFPYYKGDRKKNRENSDLDWTSIFSAMDQLREDLSTVFPYKVVHHENVEADDIIAVLCEFSQSSDVPQPMMIISSDHDFIQLHKWSNVAQFSPKTEKLIKVTQKELREKYITHIVKAGDDGIPNILSEDATIVTDGVRQKPVSAKRLEEFMVQGKDACRNDFERRNWDRNETLISFDKIPNNIKQIIIDAYIQSKPNKDTMKIMNYLIQHKCNLLIDQLQNF